MNDADPIDRRDLRIYPVLVAPGALACWLLGVAVSANGWLYGLFAMAGWAIASAIWWGFYRRFMLVREPPSRLRFYTWCSLTELGLAGAIAVGALYAPTL